MRETVMLCNRNKRRCGFGKKNKVTSCRALPRTAARIFQCTGCTRHDARTHARTRAHTRAKKKYLHIHTPITHTTHALLLRLTEVVAEVVVAGRFGDDRRAVRDGNVLQVQEAELDLHGEEDLQLAAHGLARHLAAQQDAQAVRPQAELTTPETEGLDEDKSQWTSCRCRIEKRRQGSLHTGSDLAANLSRYCSEPCGLYRGEAVSVSFSSPTRGRFSYSEFRCKEDILPLCDARDYG